MKELLLRQGGTQYRTRSQQERNSGCATGRAGQRAAEILECCGSSALIIPSWNPAEFHADHQSLKAHGGISGPRAAPLKLKPNDVPNHSFV
jgi:hypothetical protein